MSEPTIESLQTEVDALRRKNAELLGKLREAKDELTKVESVRAELKERQTAAAWESLYKGSGVDKTFAENGLIQRELRHAGFDILVDDEGPYIADSSGEPVRMAVKLPNGVEREGDILRPENHEHAAWFGEKMRGFMPLAFPRPVGAGTPGGGTRHLPTPKQDDIQKPLEKQQFGLR